MNRFYVETRSQVEGNRLVGHAAVFNSLADLGRTYEALDPKVFDSVLGADVRALFNHDPSQILARTSNGSLKLSVDNTGLAFDMELPNTTLGNDVKEMVRSGLVTGMSFGFIPGESSFSKAPDGKQIRTHTSIKQLLDISPVVFPAYEGTDLALRSIDDMEFSKNPATKGRLILARSRFLLFKENI